MANILAVDDSASMRQMMAYILEAEGHHVAQAQNGEQALEIARSAAFDLVLTDVNMPVMDGLTLTRELRQLTAYKFAPIVIITTESGMDKKQQGHDAGATGWLSKPVNPEQLLETINKILE